MGGGWKGLIWGADGLKLCSGKRCLLHGQLDCDSRSLVQEESPGVLGTESDAWEAQLSH